MTLVRVCSAPAYLIDSQLFTTEFANSISLKRKSSLAYSPFTMNSWMTSDLTSFSTVSQSSGRREVENERLNALKHRLRLRASVAHLVKRWPTDLAVPSSIPTRGEIFSNVNGVRLSTSHRPDMTEILLERPSSYPSFTADKVSTSSGNGARAARSADNRFTHCAMGLVSLQKSLAESPGKDHEDAGEVKVLNEKMAQTTCIRTV